MFKEKVSRPFFFAVLIILPSIAIWNTRFPSCIYFFLWLLLLVPSHDSLHLPPTPSSFSRLPTSLLTRYFFYLCSWRHILSGALLGVLGYIFGGLLSALAGHSRPQVIAISLETAIQNGGVAFIVLNLTFESPYSDMGIMPILSFFFFSTGKAVLPTDHPQPSNNSIIRTVLNNTAAVPAPYRCFTVNLVWWKEGRTKYVIMAYFNAIYECEPKSD